jgi:ornithine carbamoyltransferase
MGSKDFVSLRDFSPSELEYLLVLGRQVKANPSFYHEALQGKTLAMIFEKPSLRTRVSFDVGIHQLGGHALYLSAAEISLGKRESLYDVAKNLERMVQGIVIRTFAHETVEQMARYAGVPVINALTDFSHPCQALADYLTMWETKGRLKGLKVAFVGDGSNVAHSLMFAGVQLGAQIRVATPPGYEPKAEATEWALERALETGGSFTLTYDPIAAVAGADVVYTDVWTSMGQEDQAEKRRGAFRVFQVNSTLFAHAERDAIFMHCLPAHRGEEVTAAVIDSAHSVVFQQAENRLHVQKAIMMELMRAVPAEAIRPAEAHALVPS